MNLLTSLLPSGVAGQVTGVAGRVAGAAGRMARSNPLTPRGRMARHAWVRNGRAHIEVRAIHQPGNEELAGSVKKALEALEAVHWAEVNAVVGRVVVAFDQDAIDPEDLFGVIEAVEEAWSVDNESFPPGRPEHPSDTQPLQRSLVALGAYVVGIGVITAARFLKLPRVPAEVASVLPFIDAQPRLRQALGDVVGTPAAELGLALGNAVTQAMAQGPLGLVVDAAHRANQIAEIRARQRVWASREPICGPGLAQAQLVIEATTLAREVSRRSAGLALAGSAIAGALGLIGSGPQAARRSPLAVNGAALASVAWGAWSGFGLSRLPAPVPAESSPWHVMPAEVALRSLASTPSGLAPGEAARRRRTGSGPAAPQGWGQFVAAVVEELANPLTPILAAGAGLSAATGSTVDAALVGGVAVGSAVFSALYQLRTAALLEHLVQAGVVEATVRRAGLERQIPADQLVPGDVVVLEAGNVVPADLRIIEATSLEVDESSLTGESLPVPKGRAPSGPASVAERTCMLYEGTTIANGTGFGLVVATGPATEIGRSLHLGASTPRAGVEARLRSLTKIALPVALGGGIGLVASGALRGLPLSEALAPGVALSVAAVPEGLPFVANAASMAAARRLCARGALVRNARTIEALGRVDVLCFDKTGTLTEGRLTLRVISDGGTEEPLEALGPSQRRALAAGLRSSPEPAEEALPHATDQAVLEAAVAAGVRVSEGLGPWRRIAELPFEPARGFHLALGASGPRRILSVKGAPEAILPACARWRVPDGILVLDTKARQRIKAQMERLARRGLRVLAVAEREVSGDEPSDLVSLAEAGLSELEFVGFLAFADRARSTAAAAVAELRRAGVEVRMATGDHPLTARAIAGDLGILESGEVLTGGELDALSDAALDTVLPAVSVFARVTPAHKARIVAAYQRLGHRVAMTGDGANDAPAIRLADVGFAIGRRATPAAREAADIVVTDDRLETIIHAIVEGRAMWASLRDALALLMGGNLGEIGFTLAASALTGRSPLNTRQLLLVNLLTDLAPALAIAVQPPRQRSPEELLREGPDASLGPALTRQIGLRAATTAAGATGAWVVARPAGGRARASTIALTALVGTQLGQTLAAGRRSPLVAGTVLASGAALIAVIQTPGVSQFFGCTPLGPVGWATAAGAACTATGASVILPAAARSIRRRGNETSTTG